MSQLDGKSARRNLRSEGLTAMRVGRTAAREGAPWQTVTGEQVTWLTGPPAPPPSVPPMVGDSPPGPVPSPPAPDPFDIGYEYQPATERFSADARTLLRGGLGELDDETLALLPDYPADADDASASRWLIACAQIVIAREPLAGKHSAPEPDDEPDDDLPPAAIEPDEMTQDLLNDLVSSPDPTLAEIPEPVADLATDAPVKPVNIDEVVAAILAAQQAGARRPLFARREPKPADPAKPQRHVKVAWPFEIARQWLVVGGVLVASGVAVFTVVRFTSGGPAVVVVNDGATKTAATAVQVTAPKAAATIANPLAGLTGCPAGTAIQLTTPAILVIGAPAANDPLTSVLTEEGPMTLSGSAILGVAAQIVSQPPGTEVLKLRIYDAALADTVPPVVAMPDKANPSSVPLFSCSAPAPTFAGTGR